MTKIEKKLQYWCSIRLNTTGREVIANGVLISTLFYFLAIWGGTKAGVQKIISKIRNFYWSGFVQQCRARVAWKMCCQKRVEGGLNLMDPMDALTSMMGR
jgi:hypothetical protein